MSQFSHTGKLRDAEDDDANSDINSNDGSLDLEHSASNRDRTEVDEVEVAEIAVVEQVESALVGEGAATVGAAVPGQGAQVGENAQ